MDNRCKASFDPKVPSYFCASYSPDCLINVQLNSERGRDDVYVLPGGSCVPNKLNHNFYEGIVGVACSQELTIGGNYLKALGRAGQAVPLVKTAVPTHDLALKPLKECYRFL